MNKNKVFFSKDKSFSSKLYVLAQLNLKYKLDMYNKTSRCLVYNEDIGL